MKRNTTTLFLTSPGATTPIPWVNNAPDFTGITEPTLSVLTNAWNDFVINDGVLEIIPDPAPVVEPVVPNWAGFNAVISFDVNMINYEAVANQAHPSIVSKKDLAYSFVDTKGLDNFAAIFPMFCQIAGVTPEHREQWAALAQEHNLPIEFVEVLRG